MKTVRRLLQPVPRLPVGNYYNQCHKVVAYMLVLFMLRKSCALRFKNSCHLWTYYFFFMCFSWGFPFYLSSIPSAGSPMRIATTNTLNNSVRHHMRIHIPRASPYSFLLTNYFKTKYLHLFIVF